MRARACRGLVAKKKTERSRGEKEKRGSNELKVKSVWKREEAEREREREEKRKERKLWERTNWADIALEFARRVYAIFTLDLIFWRRPSLSRDRYMSHGHTRAARIKTSKRSQREFLIPSAARFSSPPPSFPSPREHLLLDSRCPVIPFATILGIPFFSTNRFLSPPPFSPPSGPKMGYKKTKNRRASPITGSVFLSSSRFPTPLTAGLTTCWPAPYKLCIDNLLLGQLRIYWNIDDNACEKWKLILLLRLFDLRMVWITRGNQWGKLFV